MWITSLELRNIKSHRDSGVIPFAHGVNAISGPNGAGKSTLLEAIGFALFDSLPYSQKQFLREGEKSGEVVVSFIDVLDEREYQIARAVGSGSIYVFDPEIQSKLVTGKADVVAWLKEHLGVDLSADLTALFEDSIGVPQGLLSSAFLERPAARKSNFDPLLQVDEFEEVWMRLREVVRLLNDQIEAIRHEIAELSGELKLLPTLVNEKADLELNIETNQAKHTELHSELESLEQEQAALEAEKTRIQEAKVKLETLDSRLKNLSNQVQEAQSSVSESEKASDLMEATSAAHKAYLQAEEQLATLEQKRSERDRLTIELNNLDKKKALSQQRLSRVEAALVELKDIEKEMQQIEPRVTRQQELSQAVSDLRKRIAELEAQHDVFTSEQEKLGLLEVKLADTRKAFEQGENLRRQSEATQSEVQSLELGIARLETDRAAIQAELKKVGQNRSTLKQTTEADCPVCHQPLDRAHREELLSQYDEQLDGLAKRDAELDADLEKNRQALIEKRKLLNDLTTELHGAPDERQLISLEQEYGTQKAKLENKSEELQVLVEEKKQLAVVEQKLGELDDPKTKWALLNTQLAKRDEFQEEHAQTSTELQNLSVELESLNKELAAFANLDKQLSVYQAQRHDNKEAYRKYLANEAIAGKLEARRTRLGDLTEELEAARKEMEHKKLSYERAEQEFDDSRFSQVHADVISTARELARLETLVDESGKRLARLESDISTLKAQEEQLANSQAELERRQSTLEALEFIRGTIRKAGPFVTRALVQTISLEANRIFGEIMNDHSLRLIWNDDYSITLEQSGERRDFSQLSGGEKTAAALSVRLALLRELSQIRVAFFDEPTSNLDDQRRENLASQITQITGFNQLFVISHDDTFERETHHVIHVEKSENVSQVEVA